jgi:hypothetical protein
MWYVGRDRTGAYRVWWVVLKRTDHLEELDLDGRLISKLIFKKWEAGAWTGLIWLGKGIGGGPL